MNQFRFSCAVDDLALFVSDGWHSLPPQVWVAICKLTPCLTGAKPPQRARTAGSIKTVDMQHLLEAYPKESQIIHWVFAKLEEFPHVKTGDMLAFHGIRAEALYFQSDHKRTGGPPRGDLDPAITVQVFVLKDLGPL